MLLIADIATYLRIHETKIRFVLAGGINTAFGIGVYPAMYLILKPLSLHYTVVLALAQTASIVFAYITQKLITFRTKGAYVREFIKFSTFYVGYFGFNLVLLPLLVEVLRINPVVAQTFISIGVVFASFFWHSRVTFHSPCEEQSEVT